MAQHGRPMGHTERRGTAGPTQDGCQVRNGVAWSVGVLQCELLHRPESRIARFLSKTFPGASASGACWFDRDDKKEIGWGRHRYWMAGTRGLDAGELTDDEGRAGGAGLYWALLVASAWCLSFAGGNGPIGSPGQP
jgi:hypothetical protein